MSDLVIPADGNYSSWLGYLSDKVDKYCDNRTFAIPDGTLGSGLFTHISDRDQADKLVQWLTSQIGFGKYFASKVGPLIVVCFGLVILILCIILAFAVLPKMRRAISKWFCGACKDRHRTRFEDVESIWRVLSWTILVVAAVCLLATSITMIVDNVQILQGENDAMCNTWLQMRGHFFGVSTYNKGDVTDVAWDWKGTMSQLNELENISAKVEPVENNPLKMDIESSYYDLQVYLNSSSNETMTFVDSVTNMMRGMDDVVNAANSMLTPLETGTDVKMWLADVSIDKSIEYNEVLTDTLNNGYIAINETIDKYLGPGSALLAEGYSMAGDAIQSLKDTNEYIGNLLIRWDELEGWLNGALKFLVAIGFIVAIVTIIFGCLAVYVVVFKLVLGSYRHDRMPSKSTLNALKFSYIAFILLAGFSALSCGLQYMLASIGWDACTMAEDDLFTEGNWDILGQTLLNCVENSTVDIRQILDICVRSDGDGNVANGLGIQGLLSSLETSTTMAQTDILDIVNKVLNPPDKVVRAELMHVAFHDTLMFIYRSEQLSVNEKGDDFYGYFNDTHYVRSDYLEDDFVNWPLLCLAPALGRPTAEVLQMCLQDLTFGAAPMNRAIDKLNSDVSPLVHPLNPEFPASFCSPFNQENGHPCKDDPNAYNIDKDFRKRNGDLDKFIQMIQDTTIEDSDILASKFKFVADGVGTHEQMYALPFADILVQVNNASSFAHELVCSDSGEQADCTYKQIKQYLEAYFVSISDRFLDDANDLLDHVNAFVQDPVLSTMNSLIQDGKSSLQDFNCQFVGTSLHAGATEALCKALMPGVALLALLFACHFFICLLTAWGCWKHYHYVIDISSEWGNDYAAESKTYNEAQTSLLKDSAIRQVYAGSMSPEAIHGAYYPAEASVTSAFGEGDTAGWSEEPAAAVSGSPSKALSLRTVEPRTYGPSYELQSILNHNCDDSSIDIPVDPSFY